ncbi:hypothetical protein DSM104299_02551 [Baekduia alba]|uniref:hypothetical protein n=1 Tax=Baekduia alba TaxID=2997333 RepID=UPI0023405E63|nr:hypothetical protein [Baekduia alba]WCB93831.1 hypothetical protein DSM104299_02551 [Baekduia alba]
MSQPPSESGNVVDPAVLASRRARRAEVSEDATLELRLFEAERRLGEVAAERDALRAQVALLERDVRGTRQREWAEQQQRLEAQGEAAAAREVAGSQLADLRERLAEAEAEVAIVAAERDRARRALEDEQLRTTAERERREALEREGLLLRAELARRDDLTAAAADAVAEARRSLAGARDVEGLEARIAVERQEFAARVVAVERAVASVRERLGAAARVLRDKLEVERDARTAAEAALGAERTARVAADRSLAAARSELEASRARVVELERERAGFETGLGAERVRTVELERELTAARERMAELEARGGAAVDLERELARRDAVEAELRTALEGVSGELAAVRAGDDARIAQLAARVESVVALASGQDDLAASLTVMRARVAELQKGLNDFSTVREELEAERAARWVAEAELDAERRRGDADRARLADAETELSELRAAGRPGSGPDPSTLASLRSAIDALRAPEAPGEGAPSLSVDLAAAAARLRAATEAAVGEDATPVEAAPSASDSVAPPAAAPGVARAAPPAAAPSVGQAAPPAAAQATPPTAAPPAAAPSVAPAGPQRQPVPERAPIGKVGPWLRDALVSLAADEPDIAELIVVGLLPLQAGLVKGALAYELAVDRGTTHRVLVDDERVRVELSGAAVAEARIAGPLAALVPLAAGGAGRRLPGTRIDNRRHVRRLIKARRRPLGLAELAAAGVAPSPGLLLTVLARAVRPSWTQGRPLTVDVASEGADRWRVIASGHSPLAIFPAEGAPPAPATLHTSASRLPAVLAGTAAAGEATVEGDVRDVRTLLSWLDRAQRAAG